MQCHHPMCRNDFRPAHHEQVYCSAECRKAWTLWAKTEGPKLMREIVLWRVGRKRGGAGPSYPLSGLARLADDVIFDERQRRERVAKAAELAAWAGP